MICELMEERSILERILGKSSKKDKIVKERKRAELVELFERIQNSKNEVVAELELLRKDDVKVGWDVWGVMGWVWLVKSGHLI